MIDFRYHIVSLIAVFLALALGLFLGSTTLQSTVTHNLRSQADRVTSQNRTDEAKNKLLSSELKDELAQSAAVEQYAVSGRLTGETVAVLTAPDVSSSDRNDLVSTLEHAGATITANVMLQSSYLDPAQDAELGALASEIAVPKHPLPAGNGATQVSSVIANVLMAKPGHHGVAQSRVDAALGALTDGKFISVSGTPSLRPATLAVLLVGGPDKGVSTTAAQAQTQLLLGLAADLRANGAGTVLVGPPTADGEKDGAFAAALADSTLRKTVATVSLDQEGQHLDPAAGRVAVVLALSQAASGRVGAYGLDQTPPLPAPTATP